MILRPLGAAALAALALGACQDGGDLARAETVRPATVAADGYVGAWAVTDALCTDGAWRFTKAALSTAGEVDCEIADVDQGVASWSLSVACLADGQSTPGRLTLVLLDARNPDVMTLQGGPFPTSVTLTRCNA